jgi:hypothetical protein
MRWLVPSVLLGALCIAATAPGYADDAKLIDPGQMKWVPLDSTPGTEITVLAGDPGKEGLFVIEWRGPASTKVPPHWHTNTERITMLSGSGILGMGDSLDVSKGMTVNPGAYGEMPGKMHHWYAAQSPFIMLIEGTGPADIHFINPADEPKKNAVR